MYPEKMLWSHHVMQEDKSAIYFLGIRTSGAIPFLSDLAIYQHGTEFEGERDKEVDQNAGKLGASGVQKALISGTVETGTQTHSLMFPFRLSCTRFSVYSFSCNFYFCIF